MPSGHVAVGAHHFLAIEKLLGDNGSEAPQHVMPGVYHHLLGVHARPRHHGCSLLYSGSCRGSLLDPACEAS